MPTFCYLGDAIGQAGGCTEAVTARIRSAWKKFRDLLPVLTNRGFSLRSRGHTYQACVRSVLLYGSETWPVNTEDIRRLQRTDSAMIWWLSGGNRKEGWTSELIRERLGLLSIEETLRTNRLRWYGHIQRMEDVAWQKKITTMEISDAPLPRGRPRKRWSDNIKKDLKDLNLTPELTQDRNAWRRRIRRCHGPECVQPPGMGSIWTLNVQ